MSLILPFPTYPDIDKPAYMNGFEPFLSSKNMLFLRAAYAFSKEGHEGIPRDDGHRYFDHPRACSWITAEELNIFDIELHCALLLHDILEDTYLLTVEMIEMIFGESTAIMVNLMTHRKDDPIKVYVGNLIRSGRARAQGAKLIDRLHNMRTLGGCTPEKRQEKCIETRTHYLPLAEHLITHINSRYRDNAIYIRDEITTALEFWEANITLAV